MLLLRSNRRSTLDCTLDFRFKVEIRRAIGRKRRMAELFAVTKQSCDVVLRTRKAAQEGIPALLRAR